MPRGRRHRRLRRPAPTASSWGDARRGWTKPRECWIHKYLYYSMLLLFPTPTPCAFLRGSLSLSASHGPPKARSTGLLGLSLSSGGPLGRPKTEFKRIYGYTGFGYRSFLRQIPT